MHHVTNIAVPNPNSRPNTAFICLTFSGQEFLWFTLDLHAFYWLVWDLGRKPELMPPLPLQTDARHPLMSWGGSRVEKGGRIAE